MPTTKPVIYRISTPVPDFSGDVGGCHFAKGVYEGEVSDGPLAYFTSQGYSVEEIKTPRAGRAASAEDIQAQIDAGIAAGIAAFKAEQALAEYEAMTVDELQKLLAAGGLATSGVKADLIARLIEADQSDAADAADNSGSTE